MLIIGDTHFGIEHHLRKSGFVVQDCAERIAGNLLEIARAWNVKKLLHLGDVKHTIGGCTHAEKKGITRFFMTLKTHFDEIVVVKGNHDGGIENVLPDFVKITGSFRAGSTAFLHGHRYPGAQIKDCRKIVCGHMHPSLKFVDGLGKAKVQRCWLIACVNAAFRKKFGLRNAKTLMVIPSANELVGMREINNPLLDGFMVSWRFMSKTRSEVYLTDGTFVGSGEQIFRVQDGRL
ncbi:MAG: metallophosphoesterase [Thermoplasmata archaeon]